MALAAYAITITQMCNWGLTAMGSRNRIADIDTTEDTEEWRLCDLFFWQATMEAMAAGEWGFATDRLGITQDGTDPTIGSYDHRFAVPTDSLRILFQIDKDNDDVHYNYKREGDWLLSSITDEDDKAYFRYIKEIIDVSKFSPLFVKAAYTNLAILLRDSLIGADEWYLRLVDQYKDILKSAIDQSEMEDYATEGNNDVLEAADGGIGCRKCGQPWGYCRC